VAKSSADSSASITAVDYAVSTPTKEKTEVDPKNVTPAAANSTANNAVDEEAIEAARQEAVKAERSRVSTIRSMVKEAGLKDSFAQKLIDEGLNETEAKRSVENLTAYLEESKAEEVSNRTSIEAGRDERDTTRAAVAKALLHRHRPSQNAVAGDDPARAFMSYSMMDLARHFVEASGRNPRNMSRVEIAQASFHTTSDFPLILENVVGKSLRDGYELAPRVFPLIGTRETLPDFKEVSRVAMGSAPKPEKVLEGGEYTYGELGESGEKYRVFKYGKILALTWESLINDDLNAFTRVPMKMGTAAAQLESDIFFAEITGNPALSDGTAFFHTDRGNIAGANAAISIASLGAGRNAMRQMKDGDHFLNLQPEFLLVPSALETLAEQFVSQNLQADSSGNINPFAGRLQVISEPRLDVNSTSAWYLAASPNAIDTVAYAYLQGEEGPQITSLT